MIERRNISARLRNCLTLEQELKTPDGAGGFTRTWKKQADLWAEISPINGKEPVFAGQLTAEITHKITIRYRADITAEMRFSFGERVFNIHAVLNPKDGSETLEIWASEER